MRAPRDEVCFTVALYGTALEHSKIVPLMSDVVELLRVTGQQPSHLTAVARGFGKKPLLFDRAWKRLRKAAPADVQSVSMYSLIDNWHTLSDWTATCAIYQDWSCFMVGAGLASMPDAKPRFLELVRRWLATIQPAYGIGFSRRRDEGPIAYTIGLSFGVGDDTADSGPEYEEDLATCRWADGMDESVHAQGILRDVYPCSLLTPRHLQRDIDGRPLWAWIQEKTQRGHLAPFDESGEYTLWTVQTAQVATVRRQLAAAGGLYVLERVNHL